MPNVIVDATLGISLQEVLELPPGSMVLCVSTSGYFGQDELYMVVTYRMAKLGPRDQAKRLLYVYSGVLWTESINETESAVDNKAVFREIGQNETVRLTPWRK